MEKQKQKRDRWKLELPENVGDKLRELRATGGNGLHAYIVALRDKGWSLSAIATPLGVTREGVRYLGSTHPFDVSYSWLVCNSNGYEVPELPTKPVRNRTKKQLTPTN